LSSKTVAKFILSVDLIEQGKVMFEVVLKFWANGNLFSNNDIYYLF